MSVLFWGGAEARRFLFRNRPFGRSIQRGGNRRAPASSIQTQALNAPLTILFYFVMIEEVPSLLNFMFPRRVEDLPPL